MMLWFHNLVLLTYVFKQDSPVLSHDATKALCQKNVGQQGCQTEGFWQKKGCLAKKVELGKTFTTMQYQRKS